MLDKIKKNLKTTYVAFVLEEAQRIIFNEFFRNKFYLIKNIFKLVPADTHV